MYRRTKDLQQKKLNDNNKESTYTSPQPKDPPKRDISPQELLKWLLIICILMSPNLVSGVDAQNSSGSFFGNGSSFFSSPNSSSLSNNGSDETPTLRLSYINEIKFTIDQNPMVAINCSLFPFKGPLLMSNPEGKICVNTSGSWACCPHFQGDVFWTHCKPSCYRYAFASSANMLHTEITKTTITFPSLQNLHHSTKITHDTGYSLVQLGTPKTEASTHCCARSEVDLFTHVIPQHYLTGICPHDGVFCVKIEEQTTYSQDTTDYSEVHQVVLSLMLISCYYLCCDLFIRTKMFISQIPPADLPWYLAGPHYIACFLLCLTAQVISPFFSITSYVYKSFSDTYKMEKNLFESITHWSQARKIQGLSEESVLSLLPPVFILTNEHKDEYKIDPFKSDLVQNIIKQHLESRKSILEQENIEMQQICRQYNKFTLPLKVSGLEYLILSCFFTFTSPRSFIKLLTLIFCTSLTAVSSQVYIGDLPSPSSSFELPGSVLSGSYGFNNYMIDFQLSTSPQLVSIASSYDHCPSCVLAYAQASGPSTKYWGGIDLSHVNSQEKCYEYTYTAFGSIYQKTMCFASTQTFSPTMLCQTEVLNLDKKYRVVGIVETGECPGANIAHAMCVLAPIDSDPITERVIFLLPQQQKVQVKFSVQNSTPLLTSNGFAIGSDSWSEICKSIVLRNNGTLRAFCITEDIYSLPGAVPSTSKTGNVQFPPGSMFPKLPFSSTVTSLNSGFSSLKGVCDSTMLSLEVCASYLSTSCQQITKPISEYKKIELFSVDFNSIQKEEILNFEFWNNEQNFSAMKFQPTFSQQRKDDYYQWFKKEDLKQNNTNVPERPFRFMTQRTLLDDIPHSYWLWSNIPACDIPITHSSCNNDHVSDSLSSIKVYEGQTAGNLDYNQFHCSFPNSLPQGFLTNLEDESISFAEDSIDSCNTKDCLVQQIEKETFSFAAATTEVLIGTAFYCSHHTTVKFKRNNYNYNQQTLALSPRTGSPMIVQAVPLLSARLSENPFSGWDTSATVASFGKYQHMNNQTFVTSVCLASNIGFSSVTCGNQTKTGVCPSFFSTFKKKCVPIGNYSKDFSSSSGHSLVTHLHNQVDFGTDANLTVLKPIVKKSYILKPSSNWFSNLFGSLGGVLGGVFGALSALMLGGLALLTHLPGSLLGGRCLSNLPCSDCCTMIKNIFLAVFCCFCCVASFKIKGFVDDILPESEQKSEERKIKYVPSENAGEFVKESGEERSKKHENDADDDVV